MTFAVLVLSSLGLPVGLSQKMYLQEDLGRTSLSELLDLVLVIFRVVLIAELIGVVALAVVFVPDFGWAEGLWQSLFHSISAFNNAGFSLFSNSLVDYALDPIVNVAITSCCSSSGASASWCSRTSSATAAGTATRCTRRSCSRAPPG